MVASVTDKTPISEFLAALLGAKGINQRQLAAYVEASPAAVNDWLLAKRIPEPKYCWRLAELAKAPVEEVMRLAGHLPPLDEEPAAPELPDWARLLPMLSKADAEYVGRLVESMARNPVQPDEPPSPEAPR